MHFFLEWALKIALCFAKGKAFFVFRWRWQKHFEWSVIKLALCKEWTKDFWWCLLRLWNPITKKKLDCFYDKQISLSWLKTLAKNTKSKQVFFWSEINNFAKLLFLFCNLVVLNRLFALGIKSFLEMTFNVP